MKWRTFSCVRASAGCQSAGRFVIIDSDDQLCLLKRTHPVDEKQWYHALSLVIIITKDEGLRPQHIDVYDPLVAFISKFMPPIRPPATCRLGRFYDWLSAYSVRAHELWL